jgi:type II secretory pathway predicted ATPase ExeA
MYQDHFGLQRHLFEDGIAQGVDVFLGAPQKLAVTNLGVALTLRDSVAVLTGPAGVGKTTLVAHTLRSLTTRLALGWVGTAPTTGHELLEMLLTEFGFSPYKNSRVERLQIWRQHLNEMRATDTRVCVLVESAESFQPDVLVALESLTAADPNGCPGANVVLTSRTGLAGLLAEPALAALKQRTRLRWNLEPLTRTELRDYLAHCITAAGGKTLKLFTDDAIDVLHQYAGGIIRTANNLCATALTLAASAREPQVSASLLTQVAVDVFGLGPAPAVPVTPAPAVARAEPSSAAAAAAAVTRPRPPPAAAPPPVAPRPVAVPPPIAVSSPAGVPPPAAVAPPAVAPTAAAAPIPAMAPSTVSGPHALAAKVAATRAAQASTQRTAPQAKPASMPSAIGLKAATAQAQPTAPAAAQATSFAKPTPLAPTRAVAPSRSAPPMRAPSHAAVPAASAEAPKPSADRDRPLASSPRPAPPPPNRATAAARTDVKAPSIGTEPETDVPVLTVEFESSPEVAVEEFSFDLALSAGEIDAVLGKDSSDVPVLTDSVEPPSEEAGLDDSMILGFDEETQHKLANLEALANAKALEDISNSMAETLFGDAELDKLAATLALATGSKRDDKADDDEPLRPTSARTAP